MFRVRTLVHTTAVITEPLSIVLVSIGVVLGALSTSRYIYGMFQGEVKPNKVSWLIWGLAPLIGGSAMLSDGFSWTVVPVIMAGLWPLTVFLGSLLVKQSYWKTTTFDYTCGFLSFLALVLWQMLSLPLLAVILTVAADFIAGLPTIKKAWTNPETENSWIFATAMYSQSVALLVMAEFSWLLALFPLYLLGFSTLLVWLCVRKRFI